MKTKPRGEGWKSEIEQGSWIWSSTKKTHYGDKFGQTSREQSLHLSLGSSRVGVNTKIRHGAVKLADKLVGNSSEVQGLLVPGYGLLNSSLCLGKGSEIPAKRWQL